MLESVIGSQFHAALSMMQQAAGLHHLLPPAG
jgi:hypothetical protein